MKINIDKDKIQYYRKNPSNFLEEIYNIKLLPYQKVYLNKILKEDKIYIPISHLYSDNSKFFLTPLIMLIKTIKRKL